MTGCRLQENPSRPQTTAHKQNNCGESQKLQDLCCAGDTEPLLDSQHHLSSQGGPEAPPFPVEAEESQFPDYSHQLLQGDNKVHPDLLSHFVVQELHNCKPCENIIKYYQGLSILQQHLIQQPLHPQIHQY